LINEKIAPNPITTSPPVGSIILDELLRRYLLSIGLSQFRDLSVTELKQYALLSIYRVMDKHRLEGINVEEFWDLIQPGTANGHIRLLPDTEEGHTYHTEQLKKKHGGEKNEETVLLRDIRNVKTFIRVVFINMIIEDKRAESRQEGIKTRVINEDASSVRRGQKRTEGHQPIDDVLRYMREQREEVELDAARLVMRRVQAKMKSEDLRIIKLLLEGYTPREVAHVLDLDVDIIYALHRGYRNSCKKVWDKLYGIG
jgi:DNA-directed RNA polymerase specialized sigma24 family protein